MKKKTRISKSFLYYLGALVVVGLLAGILMIRSGSQSVSLQKATAFALKDHLGQSYRLQDFRGKVVLLHFWATWCPPCLEEIPHVIQMAKQLQNKPIMILAISVDQRWEDALKIFPVKNLPDNIVLLLDPEAKVASAYGVFKFPETFFLNKDFYVVTRWIGSQNWEKDYYEKLMSKYL